MNLLKVTQPVSGLGVQARSFGISHPSISHHLRRSPPFPAPHPTRPMPSPPSPSTFPETLATPKLTELSWSLLTNHDTLPKLPGLS